MDFNKVKIYAVKIYVIVTNYNYEYCISSFYYPIIVNENIFSREESMEPVEKKALEFLLELSRGIRLMQMYSEKHPTVKQAIQKCQGFLAQALRLQPTISFGKGDGVLLIQNKQMTEKNAIADRFVQMIGERNINGVIIRQGVSNAELESFIKLVATKKDHVVVDGQIKPELLKPFNKIKINEIKYLMVDDEEDYESLTEARKFFNSVFSEEFKGLQGADALKKIGQVIKNIMPKIAEMDFDDREGELWEFFEKSVESFGGGGIRQTRQSLLTSVRSMDPEVQKTLFGQVIRSPQQLEAVMKRFSKERKASMLVDEIEKGGEMPGALDAILKTRGEIVQLAEALTQKLGDNDETKDKLDNIFELLNQIEVGDSLVLRKRGKVYICDPDEEACKNYLDLFKKLNFAAEVIENGRELMKMVRKADTRPELLVMDVKLQGLTALEILSALDMEKIRIPVILCTEMVTIENSFEVQMYPKLKFIAKPANYKDLMDAAETLCPKEEQISAERKPSMTAEMKAELNKARDIQQNLMPQEIPAMPGYDIHAFYKSYDEVGGDYYDVIPIDADHVGILVADVAGHGISGAMVMVMVRSAIRTWAHTTTSPKELLTKVNPLIVRDIISGMFVTVYYVVIDMPSRTMTCACAGHNPAVIWKYKTKECVETKKGGMPLGILSGKAFETTLKEEVIEMEKGDRMVMYTDGFVETMSPNYEEYGEERFYEALKKYAFHPSDVCVKHLFHALNKFQGSAPQHDDLTLVTVRATK